MVAPLEQFGANKLLETAESGTDHYDFMLEGVPTFVAEQDEANYHGELPCHDRYIRQSGFRAAQEACGGGNGADFCAGGCGGRVGPRLTRPQIEQTLRETHLDEEMKQMGMWDEWATGKRGRVE